MTRGATPRADLPQGAPRDAGVLFSIRFMWLRAFALGLLLGAILSIAFVAWLGARGVGALGLVLYAAAGVPVSFAVALVLSIPLTAAWFIASRLLGLRVNMVPPPVELSRCPRCAYDLSGLAPERCPECGQKLEHDDEQTLDQPA